MKKNRPCWWPCLDGGWLVECEFSQRYLNCKDAMTLCVRLFIWAIATSVNSVRQHYSACYPPAAQPSTDIQFQIPQIRLGSQVTLRGRASVCLHVLFSPNAMNIFANKICKQIRLLRLRKDYDETTTMVILNCHELFLHFMNHRQTKFYGKHPPQLHNHLTPSQ